MKRRSFLKNAGLFTVGLSLAEKAAFAKAPLKNKLPKWKGFNLLDFFSPNGKVTKSPTTAEHLKWMRDWGFDFIRIPIAYPYYLNFDRTRNITPEETYHVDEKKMDEIDNLVRLSQDNGMHVSINLHRAPGYCINAGFNEPFNLWKDQAALDAFCFHWSLWSKRHKNETSKKVSFDLLNEPSWRDDMNDQHGKKGPVPGEDYRRVAIAAKTVILKENKDHLIIADGNQGGSLVIPELIDLNIAQSCRGYSPGAISHYKAPWANKDINNLPEPKWPGQVGDKYMSRELLETFYKPWIEIMQKGVGVHCGECGAYNKTPHAVFLAWFTDVLDILSGNGIGFAPWNFIGDFGILNSGREDVAYEDWNGYKLDKKLLLLLQKY